MNYHRDFDTAWDAIKYHLGEVDETTLDDKGHIQVAQIHAMVLLDDSLEKHTQAMYALAQALRKAEEQ